MAIQNTTKNYMNGESFIGKKKNKERYTLNVSDIPLIAY